MTKQYQWDKLRKWVTGRKTSNIGARRELTDDEIDQTAQAGWSAYDPAACRLLWHRASVFEVMVREEGHLQEVYNSGRARAIGGVATTLVQKALAGDTQSRCFTSDTGRLVRKAGREGARRSDARRSAARHGRRAGDRGRCVRGRTTSVTIAERTTVNQRVSDLGSIYSGEYGRRRRGRSAAVRARSNRHANRRKNAARRGEALDPPRPAEIAGAA